MQTRKLNCTPEKSLLDYTNPNPTDTHIRKVQEKKPTDSDFLIFVYTTGQKEYPATLLALISFSYNFVTETPLQ